jgi:Ribonucleotide reductase, beta subunit
MGISWDEYYKEEAPVKKEEKVNEPRVAEVCEATKQAIETPVQVESTQNVPTEDVSSEVMQNIENYTTKKDPSEDDLQKVREKMDEVLQGRVQVGQKAMINSKADLNQLVPFKYKWAWEKYLDGTANHWMPQEINMTADIALWKAADGLTDDERMIVKRSLGFFSTADSLVANNVF